MKNTKTTIRDFFQTEYLDTKRIKESFIQKWQGKTHGRSPDGVQYVTVGDLTFDYNSRRPKATTIMKYIEDSKGLDWHLFGSCQIAKVEETFDLWDTLHRAIIACVILGPDAKVPAITTQFDSGRKVHSTFWKANGGQSKQVTPEQIFIAQIRSEDPKEEQQAVYDLLHASKNIVIFEDTDVFEPKNNQAEWTIKYGPCKQMLLDIKDQTAIIDGLETYKKCFEKTYTGNKPYSIMGQIVQALSYLHFCNKDWLDNTCKGKSNKQCFVEWLDDSVRMRPDKAAHWLFKENFHDRMEKRYLGTALGIWSDFVTYFGKFVTNGSSKATTVKIEKAYNNSLKSIKKAA